MLLCCTAVSGSHAGCYRPRHAHASVLMQCNKLPRLPCQDAPATMSNRSHSTLPQQFSRPASPGCRCQRADKFDMYALLCACTGFSCLASVSNCPAGAAVDIRCRPLHQPGICSSQGHAAVGSSTLLSTPGIQCCQDLPANLARRTCRSAQKHHKYSRLNARLCSCCRPHTYARRSPAAVQPSIPCPVPLHSRPFCRT